MTSDWIEATGAPRPPATRTKLLQRIETDARVMRSRRLGQTYEQISAALRRGDDDYPPLDVSPSDVAKVARAYLKRQAEESAESAMELRQLELERLDGLTRRWQPVAEDTRPDNTANAAQASRIMLQVSKRRAELAGLDAPKQVDVRVTGNILHELEASNEDLEREMQARLATGFGAIDGTAEEV